MLNPLKTIVLMTLVTSLIHMTYVPT